MGLELIMRTGGTMGDPAEGPQGPGQRMVGFYNISNGSEGLLVGPLLPQGCRENLERGP